MGNRRLAVRNVKREDCIQRCRFFGCKNPLSNVQISNGERHCSEECYFADGTHKSKLFDDPEKVVYDDD